MSQLSDSSQDKQNWLKWFCSQEENQFLIELDEEFVRDSFNLYGLKEQFSQYNEALGMILSDDIPQKKFFKNKKFLDLYQEVIDLYGLIHARYILTQKGLQMMYKKFNQGTFGKCGRILCERQKMIPIGMSEDLRNSRVKLYCPCCEDVYLPKTCKDMDGAYFGSSFPHIFLQSFADIQIQINKHKFIPRIYGFRIYKKKGSKYYQKRQNKKQITFLDDELLEQFKQTEILKQKRQ